MLEINPVLAGKFESPDYAPAQSNINRPAPEAADDVASTGQIDGRRYTQFDRSASDVTASGDFTFNDFLDLVNPLQHIPVVSSVYRAVMGEEINPVSRVAGDILYGGPLGVASALSSGIGAAGDAVMEASTGKDVTGHVMAGLFGVGEDKAVNVAANTTADAATDVTIAAAEKAEEELLASGVIAPPPALPVTTESATAAVESPIASIAAPVAVPTETAALNQAKSFPLNRTKLPYGGVMAPVQNDIESQNRIIALSEASHSMRLGNTIYTGKYMNGTRPGPTTPPHVVAPPPIVAPQDNADFIATRSAASNVVAPAPTVQAPTAAASSGLADVATPGRNPLPQDLVHDMLVMRALQQYQSRGAGSASVGSTIDLNN